MTHPAYIAAAYVVALGVTLLMAVQSLVRLRTASRRLQAVDHRRDRNGQ